MNDSRYFVLNSLDDFRTRNIGDCVWNTQDKLFHLAMNHQPQIPKLKQEKALTEWKTSSPIMMDRFGQLGFLSEDSKQLLYALNWQHKMLFDYQKTLTPEQLLAEKQKAVAGAVLASSEEVEADTAEELSLSEVKASSGMTFTDFHLGGDGRVALIETNGTDQHGIRLVHLGRRWQIHLHWQDGEEDSFQPKRCWVDQYNHVWVVSDQQLRVYEGEPLPQFYRPWADRFEPLMINPNPLRLAWKMNLPIDRKVMALCANSSQLHILLLKSDAITQEILTLNLNFQLEQKEKLNQLKRVAMVTDIASIDTDRIFLHFYADPIEVKHCDFVCLLVNEDGIEVEKRRYPIHSQKSVRFVRGDASQIFYLSADGPKRIIPLPQARYVYEGYARLNRILDSGNPDTWWDRIYIDASIPMGCKLEIKVNAFDDYENHIDDWQIQPQPVKSPLASELAFYKSRFDHLASHQGLYEILLQRTSGEVRDIRGRYLQLEIHMQGDGRHTPIIESMRVNYPRISWQEHYLPPIFHQQQDVELANENSANGADFRERVLSSFDGMFSPIEKRITAAESWLMPLGTPQHHLPVLAGMLGEQVPRHWPEIRQRIWISCLSELQQYKGTYAGLCLALDIATDGAVARGQIVPVENYLMRRTMATILGIEMDDAQHPLTLGTRQSGNSIIGESLILTDDTSREFMSLLAPELLNQKDKEIEKKFLDDYANKISIVIHKDAESWLSNVEKIIVDYVPVSLKTKIIPTEASFILGLSPLLGIHTYLESAMKAREVILGDTWLGREGIMQNPITFSPRDRIMGAQNNAGGIS